MKKTFSFYAVCWAIVLALFNVVCFVTPDEIAGVSKYSNGFWTGYVFITIAFICQLICANYAFKADSLKKTFYRISLVGESYTSVIVMLIAGSVCMAVPAIPAWVGVIICFAVLAFSAISLFKAAAAANLVEEIDQKVKEQVQFVRQLTADAEVLYRRTDEAAIKEQCRRIYEAIRYSDPMSRQELVETESRIRVSFADFSAAADGNDTEKCTELSADILDLIEERNQKCRLLK